MKSLPRWASVTIILAAFLIADHLHEILSLTETYRQLRGEMPFYVRDGARNLLEIAICLCVVRRVWAPNIVETLRELGFKRRLPQSLAFGIAATAPMFLGFALMSPPASSAVSIETAYFEGYPR